MIIIPHYVFISYAILSILSATSSKTIISVLSGREKYLKILHKYFDVLIRENIIDEVHLWDYTINKADKAYLLQLTDAKQGYIYMPADRNYTFDINNPTFYHDYYDYYTVEENLQDGDILIKCDDDVVYIDLKGFASYMNITRYSKGFVYPNLVNDEVGAMIQSRYGIHNLSSSSSSSLSSSLNTSSFQYHKIGEDEPSFYESSDGHYITNWHHDSINAVKLHQFFLNAPSSFIINTSDIILWKQHMSITFFAGSGIIIRHFYDSFIHHHHGHTPQQFFTGSGRKHMDGKANKVIPSFIVVHFGFQEQIPLAEEMKLLPRYDSLAATITGETF